MNRWISRLVWIVVPQLHQPASTVPRCGLMVYESNITLNLLPSNYPWMPEVSILLGNHTDAPSEFGTHTGDLYDRLSKHLQVRVVTPSAYSLLRLVVFDLVVIYVHFYTYGRPISYSLASDPAETSTTLSATPSIPPPRLKSPMPNQYNETEFPRSESHRLSRRGATD